MSAKVSVIVPVYNVEKYLNRCIDHLLSQTFKDIEIILIDDGSPDNCPKICDEYQRKESKIRVIHKENGGLSDARNVGIEISSGEYVLFMDSDDWCEETMIEKLFTNIVNNFSDIAVCSFSIDYSNNNFSVYKDLDDNVYLKDEIPEFVYHLDNAGVLNYAWNKLYRKDIIKNNNIKFEKDAMPGEDLLFNCQYFKYINRATTLSTRLYHYMREDENTLVVQYKKNLYEQVERFNNSRKEIYDFYCLSNEKYMKCYSYKYIENIEACILNMFRNSCTLTMNQKIEFIKKILLDNEIKKNMAYFAPSNFYDKLFKITYSTGNAQIMHIFYYSLFTFRNKYKGLYRSIRKLILD